MSMPPKPAAAAMPLPKKRTSRVSMRIRLAFGNRAADLQPGGEHLELDVAPSPVRADGHLEPDLRGRLRPSVALAALTGRSKRAGEAALCVGPCQRLHLHLLAPLARPPDVDGADAEGDQRMLGQPVRASAKLSACQRLAVFVPVEPQLSPVVEAIAGAFASLPPSEDVVLLMEGVGGQAWAPRDNRLADACSADFRRLRGSAAGGEAPTAAPP
eukprot:CAMPEP_0175607036 /NCGR_PEP_ID=MMETSP0096-20121207/61024_1 /TAXON_ID=311494 /ORGANISM="Alexandrium monilatum, Strain CCMP3105" /LENGTH=213 /DNA_ID=CAMNT_0016911885 /DNA_START=41 /DNA_END=678 /DNA_ORIENTATION=+